MRWSLTEAPAGIDDALRTYVIDSSLGRFTGMAGLGLKTWRTRPGEWFEGTYVFETAQARDSFSETFAASSDTSPVSQLIGSAPVLHETFQVMAVAEGAAGFSAGPGPVG